MALRIIVEVYGGVVQSVYCSEEAEVAVMDWDNAEVDEECKQRCESLQTEAETLNEVF